MLMKNFTLAVLTATFVATGAFAQTSADKNILPVKTKALLEKFEKNMHAVKTMPATIKTMRAKRANEAAIWKPQHDIQYSYDEGWDKDAENNYTYNAQGLVLTQVLDAGGDFTKLENTYNSKGQITHQIMSILRTVKHTKLTRNVFRNMTSKLDIPQNMNLKYQMEKVAQRLVEAPTTQLSSEMAMAILPN